MSTQGIMISSLRKEVQLKVLSNQEKFNPDFNEVISPAEIGALLKEYNAVSAKDLQAPQGLGAKIAGYLMPKSEVYPVASGGYRVKYTDGAEDFYGSKAEYKDRSETAGKEIGQGVCGLGMGVSGLATAVTIAQYASEGGKVLGKYGMLLGLLTGAFAYVFQRFSNSRQNDKNNMAQMDMIEKDKQYQAELKKQEEERKQADLEFKERLNVAITGIDDNLQNSEAKVNRINNKLNKINQTANEVVNTLTPKEE